MRLAAGPHRILRGGIKTNIPLFEKILQDPDFQEARLDTGYLERLLGRLLVPKLDPTDRR